MLQMKLILSLVVIVLLSSLALGQSGRRAKEIKVPVPLPVEDAATANDVTAEPAKDSGTTSVTAERNQDYRCTDDETLERIIETAAGESKTSGERILTSKETDSRVVITSKPQPSYTKEARRDGVQGFVALRLLLSGNGRVTRARVVKGLPYGLTESAIRAACKMKFKPGMKDGKPVSQWVIAEYVFRLSGSQIFRP